MVRARRSAPVLTAISPAERLDSLKIVKTFNSAPVRRIRLSIKLRDNLRTSSWLTGIMVLVSFLEFRAQAKSFFA
jgi:hypothetical protein